MTNKTLKENVRTLDQGDADENCLEASSCAHQNAERVKHGTDWLARIWATRMLVHCFDLMEAHSIFDAFLQC